MGGLDFIKKIKGDFDDIDVIAITGFHAEYKYTDVIEVGASDFISKPFNINELEAKINRVIRERKMRTELKRLSVRDGLTGLYNRRYFDDNLRREASRSFRQQYGLFLLLIDIDHFKEYNDKYGHQQGDELLKNLAEIMMLHSRKNVDSVYRYGGDEFAVIIPHAKHRQAKIVANRLRSKFNQKDLGPTTLSMGMAKLKGGVETLEKDIEELLRSADRCLYHAKRKGGDQICEINHPEHLPNNPPQDSNPVSDQ
jgi:diguanylate cyclase (GGDEF)-like protein